MTANLSMLNGIFSWLTDFFTGIFAFVPQMMYFVYTCAASLLDLFQFLVRKLGGLDTYYVNGQEQTGDMVLSILKGILGIDVPEGVTQYSTISTVFWSIVIFAVIILVLATIIKIITTHYNYDSSKSNPMTIISASIKNIFTIALVPIVSLFGIAISTGLLKILDQLTSATASTTISTVYKNSKVEANAVFQSGQDSWGNTAYTSYDFFGYGAYNLVTGSGAYTNHATISGQLFAISGHFANRVRHETYTATDGGNADEWDNLGIFTSDLSDEGARREDVAHMIDYAFANNLVLKDRKTASVLAGSESLVLTSSFTYLQSAVWYLGTIQFGSFSKFNVGLVWYYYNLWSYNYLIAFAGLSIAMTLLINIIFGMISRLIFVIGLFMVYPLLLGIEPVEGGNAFKSWKTEYISNILMGYGAIIGMNLAFLVLPAMQSISFFGSIVPDGLMNTVILLAALTTVKKIVGLMSQFVGAKDANVVGGEVKEDTKKAAFAAADKAIKIASLAVKVAKIATGVGAVAEAAQMIAKKAAEKKAKEKVVEQAMNKMKQKEAEKAAKEEEATTEPSSEDTVDGKDKKPDTPDIVDEKSPDESEDGAGVDDQEDSKPSSEKGTDKLASIGLKLKEKLGKEIADGDFGSETENAKQINSWYDTRIQELKESRKSDLKRDLTASENSEVENQAKNEAVERFIRGHSLTKDVMQSFRLEKAAQRKSKLKNFGERPIIKVAAESLKAVGEFSGVSITIKKALSDQGTMDAGITLINDFAQMMHIPTSGLPKTKKQKEKEEEVAISSEATNMSTTYTYSDAVAKQMSELAILVERLQAEEDELIESVEKAKKKKTKK